MEAKAGSVQMPVLSHRTLADTTPLPALLFGVIGLTGWTIPFMLWKAVRGPCSRT